MSKKLFDIAARSQVYLERIKAGFVRDYGATQAELRDTIASILSKVEDGRLSNLTRQELRRLLAELQQAQVALTGQAMQNLLTELEPLAGFIVGSDALALSALTGTKFAAPTAKIAYQHALAEPLHATGQLLESFIQDWTATDAARVANLVRKGWAEGLTVSQVVQGIRGTARNKYQDGALNITARKARAVVQTATQHVASAARMAFYEANSDLIVGYRYIATLDNLTSQLCRSLDNQVFEPGKGPLPPMHVNCRSTTIPELGPQFDFLKQGETRASMNGQVAADQGYYTWLRTQPATFQNDAVGPVRGKLLRDGGLTAEEFRKLNLGRDFHPLTLKEMKGIDPEAFKRAGLN